MPTIFVNQKKFKLQTKENIQGTKSDSKVEELCEYPCSCISIAIVQSQMFPSEIINDLNYSVLQIGKTNKLNSLHQLLAV